MNDGPLAGLRIGLATASASRLGGGVFEAVAAQAALIRRLGGEAPVFALADRHAEDDRARFAPGEVTLAPVLGPAQVGFAPGLGAGLRGARLDLLHLHGIWMYPSLAAARWARASGRPYLISPHGMLDPWITARGRAKKALARAGYERASWQAASAFHALTPREAGDIARESGRDDALVIPNPAPVAAAPPVAARPPHLLYLGRIHPKKNLGALLAAWRMATAGLPVVGEQAPRLTIAGWGDESDVAELRRLLAAAPPTVAFVGPVYGEAKARLLGEARFLVLPSFSEGLPMVVLEAWAAGTPAILTPECNLDAGVTSGAALNCGYEPAAIAPVLTRALAMAAPEWLAMAAAAHALATGPFAPETIAGQWASAYRGLIERRMGAA